MSKYTKREIDGKLGLGDSLTREKKRKIIRDLFRKWNARTNLYHSTQEELKELFNLEKGAVPPFGQLLDIEQTFYDKKLLDFEEIAFNIGTRTDSIQIKSAGLIKLVDVTLLENITE